MIVRRRHARWQIYTREDGQSGIRLRGSNGKIVMFEGYVDIRAAKRSIAIAKEASRYPIEDLRSKK